MSKNCPPNGGNSRDWSTYNAAQVNEKSLFLLILSELCREIVEPKYGTGCPPFRLRDMIFCLVYKVYSTFSSRRLQSDLREAQAKGVSYARSRARTPFQIT